MSINPIFYRVCNHLASSTTTISTILGSGAMRKLARRKKTNRLLMSVSIIFFLSWAPLNIYNMILDIFTPFDVSRMIYRYFLIQILVYFVGQFSINTDILTTNTDIKNGSSTNSLLDGTVSPRFLSSVWELL